MAHTRLEVCHEISARALLCTQTLHLKKDVTFFDADEKGDVPLLELPHQRSVGIERASRLSKRFSVGMTCRVFNGVAFTIVFEVALLANKREKRSSRPLAPTPLPAVDGSR